jgi:hypothetical protein
MKPEILPSDDVFFWVRHYPFPYPHLEGSQWLEDTRLPKLAYSFRQEVS